MKYDPAKHHRRSIRLKGYDYSSPGAYFITVCTYQRQCLFGEIANGKMQLNRFGQIVQLHWSNLQKYHPHLKLDEFVVMPNHLHGILILIDNDVGAGLKNPPRDKSELTSKPAPTKRHGIPEIVRGFKTFSSRQINQIRHAVEVDLKESLTVETFKFVPKSTSNDVPLWQRNYYEHIVRDEASLQKIRQYICDNPLSWKLDQLYPNNLSQI